MNLCKYCNQPALYAPKTKWGGWCCAERFYDCPGYRKKLKDKCKPWNKGLKGAQIPWNKGSDNGTFKGKKHTEETKKKISESMYGNKNANHRGDRQSYYKGIRMDSSWEVLTAKYFDDNNINWKYDEKGFKLSDGRVYYPDFFIYDEDNKFIKLVEVKGYFRKANREKFEKFLNEYPDIKTELWNKKVLKEKKIL
jgi:hypothetical protein